MRAILYRRYGGPEVLDCEEVAKPSPGDGEVLIRVRAASVNPMDSHMMHPPWFLRLRRPEPKRPGADLAGVVEAVGAGVTRFQAGDAVFGVARGALADFVCAPEDKLATKPAEVSFEDAAALPVAGLTALQALRDKGGVRAGQRLLILGASGGVGTFAVQIGKTFGAHVTGVCGTGNVELVRALGADRVIDYCREDFLGAGGSYDVVLDLVGSTSLRAFRPVLAAAAIVLPCGVLGGGGVPRFGWVLRSLARAAWGALISRFTSRKLRLFVAKVLPEDLATLVGLVEAGQMKPVIGEVYPLEEAREAVRQVATGHARGKIIVQVSD